ncbi:MAG: hypothetical protein ACPIOQ_25135 [Promethearchaeia archaeon]
MLRNCGAFVGLKDYHGYTALHFAAGGGRLLTMAKLVKVCLCNSLAPHVHA